MTRRPLSCSKMIKLIINKQRKNALDCDAHVRRVGSVSIGSPFLHHVLSFQHTKKKTEKKGATKTIRIVGAKKSHGPNLCSRRVSPIWQFSIGK
jgi:hypothetical protein